MDNQPPDKLPPDSPRNLNSDALRIILILTAFFIGITFSLVSWKGSGLNEAAGRRESTINIMNASGDRIGFIGPGQAGQGTVFLFNPDGSTSIQIGSYESGSEKGQSLIGLNDRHNNLRLLMRLSGPDDSPFLVMKDKRGDDMIILGLEGEDETPVLKYRDSQGIMHNAFQN